MLPFLAPVLPIIPKHLSHLCCSPVFCALECTCAPLCRFCSSCPQPPFCYSCPHSLFSVSHKLFPMHPCSPDAHGIRRNLLIDNHPYLGPDFQYLVRGSVFHSLVHTLHCLSVYLTFASRMFVFVCERLFLPMCLACSVSVSAFMFPLCPFFDSLILHICGSVFHSLSIGECFNHPCPPIPVTRSYAFPISNCLPLWLPALLCLSGVGTSSCILYILSVALPTPCSSLTPRLSASQKYGKSVPRSTCTRLVVM